MANHSIYCLGMSIMRSISLTLIILSFFLGEESHAQSRRSEYYAGIPFWESQMQPFKGEVPLTKQAAKERIHFRLDYDSLNRVVQSNVMIGDHLKAFEGYSKLFIDAPLIKVTYPKGQEVHTFFNHYEEPISVMNGVFTKVFEKDTLGRNTSLIFLDDHGNQTEDYFGYVRYTWTHSADGSIIEERFSSDGTPGPLRGGFQFIRTRIIYGMDGYPHILQNIDSTGALINSPSGAATFKYYYDQQGRFDRWEVYDKEGNPAVGPSHTSGEQNIHYGYDLNEIRFFDRQRMPVKHWSGAERWVMEYDRYGNRTVRAFQTSEGALMNGYDGYAQHIYSWSGDGRWLQSEHYLDANGVPVNHERAQWSKKEYKRDAEGRVLATSVYMYVDERYQLK